MTEVTDDASSTQSQLKRWRAEWRDAETYGLGTCNRERAYGRGLGGIIMGSTISVDLRLAGVKVMQTGGRELGCLYRTIDPRLDCRSLQISQRGKARGQLELSRTL